MPGQGTVDWWFNPDSVCWQAMKVSAVYHAQRSGERPLQRCRYELWQSDQEGRSWRMARAETTECYDSESYPHGWKVDDPHGTRRRAAIGIGQLYEAMSLDAWGRKPQAIPSPRGESQNGIPWFFIPLRSDPERGVALRIGKRNPDSKFFLLPLYLIDRRLGTQRMLETFALGRNDELSRMRMEEYGGFLLVSGIRTYLYDLKTGNQVFPHAPTIVRRAVWIRRPALASVDSIGLRRLRARFR
jgi:hypothetical protein